MSTDIQKRCPATHRTRAKFDCSQTNTVVRTAWSQQCGASANLLVSYALGDLAENQWIAERS